jgi:hypothetical protein
MRRARLGRKLRVLVLTTLALPLSASPDFAEALRDAALHFQQRGAGSIARQRFQP